MESKHRIEGRAARKNGKSLDDCPYSYIQDRVRNSEWRKGWNLQNFEIEEGNG